MCRELIGCLPRLSDRIDDLKRFNGHGLYQVGSRRTNFSRSIGHSHALEKALLASGILVALCIVDDLLRQGIEGFDELACLCVESCRVDCFGGHNE